MKSQFVGAVVALLLSAGLALAQPALTTQPPPPTTNYLLILISYLSAGDAPALAVSVSVTKMDGNYTSFKACQDAANGAQAVRAINNPGGREYGNLAAFFFCF